MTDAIVFKNVDIIFGNRPETAIAMIDQGKTRDEIGAATGLVLGVADASLTITEGEILVLMGLSGSGKSTLLRAVNGLAPVVRGEVQVKTRHGGINPYKTSAKSLRDFRMHDVSMVFQQFALLPWRTVEDNVGFGLELAGVPDKERKDRVAEQLELVNLTKWAGRQVKELSGGMQQRVGLARAFATGAPILLMDEPFSALGPLIRTRLQDELLEFQRRLKKTILFVSHDLDEAFKLGNRIAIMEGGRIIQVGTAQDIVMRPANDYVAAFVTHMNPLNVLTAGDVMVPLDRDAGGLDARIAGSAHSHTPLRRVMEVVSDGGGEVMVSEQGRIIGRIGAQEIIAALGRHQKRG